MVIKKTLSKIWSKYRMHYVANYWANNKQVTDSVEKWVCEPSNWTEKVYSQRICSPVAVSNTVLQGSKSNLNLTILKKLHFNKIVFSVV